MRACGDSLIGLAFPPLHALAMGAELEQQQRVVKRAVQVPDSLGKAILPADLGITRQGIVDFPRPAEFLESIEEAELKRSRTSEPLEQPTAKAHLAGRPGWPIEGVRCPILSGGCAEASNGRERRVEQSFAGGRKSEDGSPPPAD